jgi:hypothetical protein
MKCNYHSQAVKFNSLRIGAKLKLNETEYIKVSSRTIRPLNALHRVFYVFLDSKVYPIQ